jgi:hypothetical protein
MGVSLRRRWRCLAASLALGWLGVSAGASAETRNALVRTVAGAEVDWEAGTVTVSAAAAANLRLPGPDAARPAAQRAAEKRAAERLTEALEALPLSAGRKPTAAAVKFAVGRAKVKDVDYQSNGGVLLSLEASFADLGRPAAAIAGRAEAGDAVKRPAAKGRGRAAEPAGTNGDDPGSDEAPTEKAEPEPAADPAKASGRPSPSDAPKEPELTIAVPSMPLEIAPRVVVGGTVGTLASAVYRVGEPPAGTKAVTAKRDKSGRLVVTGAPGARFDGAHAVIFVRSVGKR